MTNTAHVAGIGTAVPGPPIGQDELWSGRFSAHFGADRVAERIFRAAGVRTRHAAVSPLTEDVSTWSTGARMRRYVAEAAPLGKDAVGAALTDSGLRAEDVGMLVVVSCTGYATPGLDQSVAADLGMSADVQRLVVGHMGCYAAIPGLGAASDYVRARGRPAVLLCCELTSLHLQPRCDDPDGERDQVVAHALFGDAAAAVVVVPGAAAGAPGLQVLDVVARTDSATAGHMTWDVTDLGFRMGLSPEIPRVLARHVRSVVRELLDRNDSAIDDVDAWIVHPGGPRILDTVVEQLGITEDRVAASRGVLADYGNCSSATVLMIMDALRSVDRPRAGRRAVVLAFGPGLTLYAALLQAGR